MKKLIAVMLTTIFLGLGVANATEIAKTSSVAKNNSLSQADMELLFGKDAKNVDVVALSQEEMESTKGEWFFISLLTSVGVGAGIATLKWAGCKLFSSDCDWKMNVKVDF